MYGEKNDRFHVFIFSAQALSAGLLLSYGIPNDLIPELRIKTWGFHLI